MGKSRSPTNFCRLEDFQVIVKRNKIQLGFDNIYSENNEDNVKHGKTVQMTDFILLYLMRRQNTVGMLKCVESRASKLFTKRCIRSNL